MKFAVSSAIQSVLQSGGKVYIKGIGTIRSKKERKKKQGGAAEIKSGYIIQSDKKSKNKKLTKALAKGYGLEKSASRKAIKAYALAIKQDLVKYNIVTLHGIGVLSRASKRKLLLHPLYTDLPIKNILVDEPKEPLSTEELSDTSKTETTEVQVEEKKSDEDEKVTINTVSAGLSSSSAAEKIEDKLTDNSQPVVAEEDLIELTKLQHLLPEKDELKDVLKDHFYQEDDNIPSDDKMDTAPHYAASKEKGKHTPGRFRGAAPLVLALIAGSLMVFSGVKYFSGASSTENDLSAVEYDRDPSVEESSDIPHYMEDTKELAETDIAEKCIIITGAFSDPGNVRAMEDRLTYQGYDVYSESNGDLVRIGLQFDCEEKDLDNYLVQIRQNVSPNAWYLYPADYQ